jgi:hypothetical protein
MRKSRHIGAVETRFPNTNQRKCFTMESLYSITQKMPPCMHTWRELAPLLHNAPPNLFIICPACHAIAEVCIVIMLLAILASLHPPFACLCRLLIHPRASGTEVACGCCCRETHQWHAIGSLSCLNHEHFCCCCAPPAETEPVGVQLAVVVKVVVL